MELTIWLIIWFSFYFLQDRILIPKGATFRKNRAVIITLSVVYAIIAYYAFDKQTLLITNTQLLVVLLVVIILNYFFIPLHNAIHKNQKGFKLRKVSPVLGRFTELGFQQVMLFYLIKNVYASNLYTVIMSGITFSAAHSPILSQTRLLVGWRWFVIAAALIGGLIFASIINTFQNGIVYTYLLHLCFYFALGLFTSDKDQMLP